MPSSKTKKKTAKSNKSSKPAAPKRANAKKKASTKSSPRSSAKSTRAGKTTAAGSSTRTKKAAAKKSPRSAKPATSPLPASVEVGEEVLVDRRTAGPRREQERRQQGVPVAENRRQTERRKVPRRRQIDPTTCERDYTNDEIEFMQALDDYKRANGRMFPTCSEILEVIRGLGYQRLPADMPADMDGEVAAADESEPLAETLDSLQASSTTPPHAGPLPSTGVVADLGMTVGGGTSAAGHG